MKSVDDERRVFFNLGRSALNPTGRCPCAICWRYADVTQAHHVYPLSMQFKDGLTIPVQNYVWLCPTHHVAIHQRIAGALRGSSPYHINFPAEEKAKMDELVESCFSLRQRRMQCEAA